MFNLLSESDVIDLLFEKVQEFGTKIATAKEIGIPASELSHIITGNRPPSKKVLSFLGFERVVYYRSCSSE